MSKCEALLNMDECDELLKEGSNILKRLSESRAKVSCKELSREQQALLRDVLNDAQHKENALSLKLQAMNLFKESMPTSREEAKRMRHGYREIERVCDILDGKKPDKPQNKVWEKIKELLSTLATIAVIIGGIYYARELIGPNDSKGKNATISSDAETANNDDKEIPLSIASSDFPEAYSKYGIFYELSLKIEGSKIFYYVKFLEIGSGIVGSIVSENLNVPITWEIPPKFRKSSTSNTA